MQSRADVVAALEEARLEVPRQGKSYLTVRNPDDGKRWRLKGALYEHDFEPRRLDLQAPTHRGRAACLEAVERVKDRARTAVDESLRKLSAQYERERTQHAAQIATLQRQVEHFVGQVTRLIADYGTLAERLRGP